MTPAITKHDRFDIFLRQVPVTVQRLPFSQDDVQYNLEQPGKIPQFG